MRYLGDGTDGAINCSTGIPAVVFATTFTVSNGNTCTTTAGNGGFEIYATGACTIAGTLTAGSNNSALGGDFGGSGGGSGGGAAGGAAGSPSGNFQPLTLSAGGTAGGIGAAGGAGNTISANQQRWVWTKPNGIFIGGARGAQGGSSGGAYGTGGPGILLSCASINFTGTINVAGIAGTSSAANSTGAGSGGGGGYVLMIARDSIVNTGQINVMGGQGGGCYNPYIQFGDRKSVV
jgi:hypothetical protein